MEPRSALGQGYLRSCWGEIHEDCRSRRSSDALGCSLRGDSGARRRDEGTEGHVDRQQGPGDSSRGRDGRGNRGPDRRETGDRRAGRLGAHPQDDMRPRQESAHASRVREVLVPSDPMKFQWRFGARTKAAGSIVAYRGVDVGSPVTSHTGKASRRARVLGAPGASVDAAGAIVVGFLGRTTGNRIKLQKGTVRRAVARAPGRRGVIISTMDAPANAAGNTGTWWAKARGGRVGCAVGQLVALRYATGGRVGASPATSSSPIAPATPSSPEPSGGGAQPSGGRVPSRPPRPRPDAGRPGRAHGADRGSERPGSLDLGPDQRRLDPAGIDRDVERHAADHVRAQVAPLQYERHVVREHLRSDRDDATGSRPPTPGTG